MKQLIEAIVRALVDKPDEVQIKEVIGEHAHVLERVSGARSLEEAAFKSRLAIRKRASAIRDTRSAEPVEATFPHSKAALARSEAWRAGHGLPTRAIDEPGDHLDFFA